MVRIIVRRSPAILAAVLACVLTSCEVFGVLPFPGFLDKTDISLDLGDRIRSAVGDESSLTYDLRVVTADGLDPRVLLLVEPPSSVGGGFEYRGRLFFLDEDLTFLGEAQTASSLDYFSRPYAYAADDNILAGYTVLTPSGGDAGITLVAHGLEGFALTNGTETYIFSSPSGQYASFDLVYRYYTTIWGIGGEGTLKILPDASRPSAGEPNYANLGYQLVGLSYDSGTDEITFVLSEPAASRIVAARIGLGEATSGTGVLLSDPGPWPVSSSAWPVSLDADRPGVHAVSDGIFLIRRDGWMDRYGWTGTGALALDGAETRIVGDRSLTRKYAFLARLSNSYMYRFDPASRILTRYRRWW